MPRDGLAIPDALQARFLEAATAAGIELSPGAATGLFRYVDLLLQANRRLNLTRIVEPEAVLERHLLDSLVALPLLPETGRKARRLADLGTGGGLPGLPIALACPLLRATLVESTSKKAREVEAMLRPLHLTGRATVLPLRCETLGRSALHREAYDLVTARALADLRVLAEYALPLASRGGTVIAWKGPEPEEEVTRAAAALEALGGKLEGVTPYRLPWSGFAATLVRIRKTGVTPPEYPRRVGVPAKRPLGS